MNISEQIAELNNEVRAYIAPSPIQGIGVFSLRNILKGEKCYCMPNQFRKWYSVPYERMNEIRPEIREVILARWPSIINGSAFTSPLDDAWMVLFMNHSATKDNYDVNSDTAKRDIMKGEEILENYKTMRNYQIVYPWIND